MTLRRDRYRLSVRGDVTFDGTRWTIGPASFSQPTEIIAARSVVEVERALRSAERAARAGKWVAGYVAYDAAPGLVPGAVTPGDASVPLVWFGVYEEMGKPIAVDDLPRVGDWSPAMTRSQHEGAVCSIRESIEAGDTYQANLTFAMEATLEGSASALFQKMVSAQPKSYGALLDLGSAQVVSVSPELFLNVSGRVASTRPMKGTAPRGRSTEEDRLRSEGLAVSEKERAGNVMIVDLLRSDLGRIAEPGSVRVTSLFKPEKYPTVWQLTSTIECEMKLEIGFLDLLSSTFPSGSVTGAPKLSTMGIIADLEPGSRGVYCGAIGYIAPGADRFEFSVAIRTGIVTGDRLSYHVGGGITYDSDSAAEYEECLWKALILTREVSPPVLMETMLYEPGIGIELMAGHLNRLAGSAEYWDIPFDPISIGDALSVVEGGRRMKVRLLLYPGGEVEVETDNVEDWLEPVELTVASSRIDPSEPWWYHKTLERDRYPTSVEGEVLMVNLDGNVTETNVSNLMVRIGNRWFTPPLGSGCLPGVYRRKLLDENTVEERVLNLDEMRSADELAVTNAVRGWRKAVLVE